MELDQIIAQAIVKRLRHHSVQILAGDRDNVCFFVPSPGSLGRNPAADDYDQGLEDGAIRELQQIIRSSPEIKQAILRYFVGSCAARCDDRSR